MSDGDLLRLGLANHAMTAGLGSDEAWELADETVAAHPGMTVRELAAAVRTAAVDRMYPNGV